MCILFVYKGHGDPESDYSLILAANRDEFYERPAQNIAQWNGDPNVFAGLDLTAGGTWLAVSPATKKIGVLLNHPKGYVMDARKSRGKIPIDYVKSDSSTSKFIDSMKEYFRECNGFIFIMLDLGEQDTGIYSYTSNTGDLQTHTQTCLGFSNSEPASPFKKVEVGKQRMADVCSRLNKVDMKDQLVEELVELLRWDEMHLPDPVIEETHPAHYKELSSIFVCRPNVYGTRTHTLVLLTKDGDMDIIEVTLQAPIDTNNPKWVTTQLKCKVS